MSDPADAQSIVDTAVEPVSGSGEAPEPDEMEPDDHSPRRQTLRERANAPSDTVGTGSYAAITCSVLALLVTVLLIGGLLISRWLF